MICKGSKTAWDSLRIPYKLAIATTQRRWISWPECIKEGHFAPLLKICRAADVGLMSMGGDEAPLLV